MGLASIVGGVVVYPINYWLVSRHLKHGCMTLPGADGPASTLGHRSPEKTMVMADEFEKHEMADSAEHESMSTLSMFSMVAWVVFSFVVLFVALWATSAFVPIRF